MTGSSSIIKLGDYYVGGAAATYYTMSGGTFTNPRLFLGINGGANGHFTQNGGTVTMTGAEGLYIGKANGKYTLNAGTLSTSTLQFDGFTLSGFPVAQTAGSFLLNGGTLVTSRISLGTISSGVVGRFYFNGGTLQANAGAGSTSLGWIETSNGQPDSQIYTYVSQNGGKLDTNGTDRVIYTPLLHDPDYAGTDGGITKLGAGTLTLTAENTYTGVTTISAGTLQTASLLGNVTNNATLNFNRGDNFTYSGVISGSGNFVKSGAGTLTITGNSTFTGGTSVNNGALKLNTGGSIGAIRGALTINTSTTVETAAVDAFGYADGAKVNSIAINGGTLNNTAAGNCGWGVAYTLSNGALLTSNGGVSSASVLSAFAFGGASGGSTSVNVTGGVNTIAGHVDLRGDNGNPNVNFTVASGATLNITAGISSHAPDYLTVGPVGLTKLGAGTMTLTGANTYTGATVISAGTLQIGDGVTSGSLASNITNNAALVFNQPSGTSTYAGVISSTGTLVKTGPGNLKLTATNTYSGGTIVNGGILDLAGPGTGIGTIRGALTINSGATVITAGNTFGNTTGSKINTVTLNGGSLLHTGATDQGWGVVYTLNGGMLSSNGGVSSSSTGSKFSFGGPAGADTTVNVTANTTIAGRIDLRPDNGNTDKQITVAAGATLDVPAAITSAGGTAGFTKLGDGTMTLASANTYTGPTQVADGTLIVNGSLANTLVSVSAGATLGGSGTIGGLTTLSAGALLSPGNSPGTLTFTNGLTLNSGSALSLELGTASDLIRVSGGSLLGSTSGPITLNLSASTGFGVGTYPIINFNGATPVNFDTTDFIFGITVPGYDYAIAQSGNILQVQVTAVPEPSAAVLLFGSFTLALGFYRHRSSVTERRCG